MAYTLLLMPGIFMLWLPLLRRLLLAPEPMLWWHYLLLALFLILGPAGMFWILRDSYRWNIPSRWLYVSYCFASGSWFLPFYLYLIREPWLQRIAYARRNL